MSHDILGINALLPFGRRAGCGGLSSDEIASHAGLFAGGCVDWPQRLGLGTKL